MEDKTYTSNYDKQVDIARGYFLKYDQQALMDTFDLTGDETYLTGTYLGYSYRIDRKNGAVYIKEEDEFKECREYTIVMTIYDMLCHSDKNPRTPLTGKWTLVGNFAAAGSSPNANIFAQKYADAFSGKTEKLKKACMGIGGEIQPRLAGADLTVKIPAFPFFPVLLQFWDGDDEFAPQIRIMWDQCSMDYLYFETTYYLQGDLLEKLKRMIEQEDV